MFSTSTLITVPALALAWLYADSLPFAYTTRIYSQVYDLKRRLIANNNKVIPIFSTVAVKHRCWFDDIDYNLHMNNTMYNRWLDQGRVPAVCLLLGDIAINPQKYNAYYSNAGVVTLYRREIRVLTPYTMQSRLLAWDEKWIFHQHRFVLDDGTVACLALTKSVFKEKSRKTIPPAKLLAMAGHNVTDPEIEARRKRNYEEAVAPFLKMDAFINNDPYAWDEIKSDDKFRMSKL
ncbi:hypothetical protein K492DRAFT_210353 [Lichtheimia hyalospora FSU 10163]|nr:hypothetical protein K492DRAFT_210353 [Lichtheimia hyalospora FSU 10163]